AYSGSPNSEGWVSSFDLSECEFTSEGENSYFFLRPGYQLTLEGEEDDELIRLVVTVLNETRIVDGVETRIVEERETVDDELVEVSRNFFVACSPDSDIFYFGEEVDMYEDGEIVSHEGAWLAGVDDATPGVIVPAGPKVGDKFYSEFAPGIAEDRVEIQSLTETLDTPAGRFENVLKAEETTPLEPGVKEYKLYAPGVGLIQDGPLELVEFMLPEDEEPVGSQLKPQVQSVSVRGNTIQVEVNSSATISQFMLDEENKTLSFRADGQVEGEHRTELAIGKILEGPYAVAIDGQSVTDFDETNSTSGEAIISVPSAGGPHDLTITGTNVVPEFGAAMIVMMVSVIAAVMLTRGRLARGLIRSD
ncbi:MAG: hypothetical protein ACRENW_07350, partial [Thermodesulfobacteriota bacterium]